MNHIQTAPIINNSMNMSAGILTEFIRDFELRQRDGTVSFRAYIHYRMNNKLKLLESEVRVYPIDSPATVYIPDLEAHPELPSRLDTSICVLDRIHSEGIRISSDLPGQQFTVSIFPKTI